MAKSINSRPDSVAHLPHHGHNLSHSFAFTSPVGYLLPVEHDFLFPGDSVSMDFSLNTITNPLQKPCMTHVREKVDVFFVPLRKLRTCAPEIMMNVDDLPTSFIAKNNVSDGKVFPSFALDDYASYLLEYAQDLVDDETISLDVIKDELKSVMAQLRLFEHLGYNSDVFGKLASQDWRSDDYQPSVSLMFLAAYQAIYYDYYRLSNFFANDVRAYNLDYAELAPVYPQDIYHLALMHLRPYKRDYFKNIEPAPLQSSLGVLRAQNSLDFSTITNYLFGGAYGLNGADGVVGSEVTNVSVPRTPSSTLVNNVAPASNVYGTIGKDTGKLYNSGQITADSWNYGNGGVNTTSIRTAFAIEKLLRVTQRAGKHYDDQVLAHFGVKVNKGIANEVMYLGTFKQDVEFGTIISTASTEDSPLGNLAGRGYGKNAKGKTIKFKAPCHGVLMAIYSAEPDLMYHTGIDKLHTLLDVYDFPTPEFDKLGMQPLFGYERRAALDFASERLGWQFRYANFKQKYDRCTYAFTDDDYGYGDVEQEILSYGHGAFAPYVISDQNSRRLSSANRYRSSLLVSPNDTDQVFLVGFDSAAAFDANYLQYIRSGNLSLADVVRSMLSSQYTTDAFIHKLDIRYFKSTFMSTFGEPDLY